MDHQSLRNVLGILRLTKDSSSRSAVDLIREWTGGAGKEETSVLRVAAYIQEQVSNARTVISASQLSEEAKLGVQITLDGLQNAFSLNYITTSPANHLGNVAASISNLVILLDFVQGPSRQAPPKEAEELVDEVAELLDLFDDVELDPVVRDTAKRHLAILSTLLQHIPIFGVEAALVTYFELMMKVRRADVGTSDASRAKLNPLWEKMQTWGERLGTIDKLWNTGARLLGHAKNAQELLSYLPES